MRRRQATKCVMRAFQRGGPPYPYQTWQRIQRTMQRHGLMYDIVTKEWGRLGLAAETAQEGALT